jgi:DNA-binding MarR family transcriptional regulator
LIRLVRYKKRGLIVQFDSTPPMPVSPPTAQDAVKATSRLLRAGWHPIQIEALTILSDHVASPKEVAVELKLTAAKAGYVSGHIKELEKRGLVELVRTEPRRGATEHFYKAIHPLIVLDEDAERMSFEERLILSCWIISRMSVDFVMAVETGSIDERSDRQCSRFSLRLDDQGYGDLIDDYSRAFHRTLEIRTESEDRLSASAEKGKPFSAMLACFPMPQLPPDFRPQSPERGSVSRAGAMEGPSQLDAIDCSPQVSTLATTSHVKETLEVTTRLLRAGWHPIQIEALTILSDHVASPKEVAVELKLTAAKAGYVSGHIKELEKRGLVELIWTEPRGGAIQHFYRAIKPLVVTDEDAKRLSFEERLILSAWIINRITDDFLMAVEAGSIDERTDRNLSRIPLCLDQQGYQDLNEDYTQRFHRTLEIRTESEDRLSASAEKGNPFSAMLACFPMPRLW